MSLYISLTAFSIWRGFCVSGRKLLDPTTYLLSTECMCVCRVILAINSDCLPVLHSAVGIYNRELFLWRRKWILKCSIDELRVNVNQRRTGQDASKNRDSPLVGHLDQGFPYILRPHSRLLRWFSLTWKFISYWLPYRSKLYNPNHYRFLIKTINN